ncbi:MAG TPA: saccharopine dehydrogenase NADP-binding domain-containing protein [Candidatus Agrococcus pullicola]|uniref:Saccharopine dehydrogenase NADP-binding domain-containing protein n=1 Tax=Candidatus Agrococcus pullicola TaxID=2838429 RepID=A0A9D2CAQ0_9MICO|nr:saccharopine dehydrogenase NADP-binding domain-containing protein [Candidatus Agrococcus pullicola]
MSSILVYGAYGHTGRFVVEEIVRRKLRPILAGRNRRRLEELEARYRGTEVAVAAVDEADALLGAVERAAVVINCAGPFLDTGVTLSAAALNGGAHYLDISAEQAAVQQVYATNIDALPPDASLAVIPAMAFYGGLPDLMATAAVADLGAVDAIDVYIGLDRWWPTAGTRRTGERNTVTRLVVQGGSLVPVPETLEERDWTFSSPLGRQRVVGVPFSETVTIAQHLPAASVRTYLTRSAFDDVRDPVTPEPEATDASGRSSQRFVVEVVATTGSFARRITVAGRDIYAVTAPLVVEAAERLLDGRTDIRGVAAPGEVFDARDFLTSIGPDRLSITFAS